VTSAWPRQRMATPFFALCSEKFSALMATPRRSTTSFLMTCPPVAPLSRKHWSGPPCCTKISRKMEESSSFSASFLEVFLLTPFNLDLGGFLFSGWPAREGVPEIFFCSAAATGGLCFPAVSPFAASADGLQRGLCSSVVWSARPHRRHAWSCSVAVWRELPHTAHADSCSAVPCFSLPHVLHGPDRVGRLPSCACGCGAFFVGLRPRIFRVASISSVIMVCNRSVATFEVTSTCDSRAHRSCPPGRKSTCPSRPWRKMRGNSSRKAVKGKTSLRSLQKKDNASSPSPITVRSSLCV
jgi:hypothetical protein